MFRLHYMISEVLGAILAGNPDEGTAMLCQYQKVLLQLGIDNGDWSTASLLWVSADPLGNEEFGGTTEEMTAVYQYKKALAQLKATGRRPGKGDEDEADEKPADRKKKGDKGRGRGRGAPDE